MNALISTIDTLYDAIIAFTIRCIRTYVQEPKESMLPSMLPNTEAVYVDDVVIEKEEQTFKTVHDILKNDVYVATNVGRNTIMYAGSVAVPLYQNPTIEFDTQIGTIPYGEMVMMFEPRGRFFKVMWNSLEGWVLREDLVDRAIRVYPELMIGQENSVDHPNTAHIRAILGDVFGLNRSEFPLQAGEYVLYRLWKKGIRIGWPDIRPRVPGLWHKILKGMRGIHIGVTPKVGSIMEYMFNDDIGHLAYVEAIFPDDTMTISEANYPDSGIYNERELVKEEWRELRPIFITVSNVL